MAQQQQQPQDPIAQLSAMGVEQLRRYRKQVDEEVANVQNSFSALTTAQERFQMSLQTVLVLKSKEQSVMVPLTTSMFVRGETQTKGRVMVDLGCGFFVNVPVDEAVQILNRKVDYVARNRRALADKIQYLQEMSQASAKILQAKVGEMAGQQQQPVVAAAT